VVYGMPRSVVEAGVADDVVPIENIAKTIYRRVAKMTVPEEKGI